MQLLYVSFTKDGSGLKASESEGCISTAVYVCLIGTCEGTAVYAFSPVCWELVALRFLMCICVGKIILSEN